MTFVSVQGPYTRRLVFMGAHELNSNSNPGPLHTHLRSNVHPSVAILLEDKQTTGHCTKQWGNIRLVMKMTINYILFLVICYDF